MMDYTAILERVLPHVGADLLREEDRPRIHDIGGYFPLLRLGCLEFRLSEENMQVDFMLNLAGKWNERSRITQLTEKIAQLPEGPWKDTWKQADHFRQQWSTRDSRLDKLVSNQFIVFDLLPDQLPSAPPWFYFGFRPSTYGMTEEEYLDALKFSMGISFPAFPTSVYQQIRHLYRNRPSDTVIPAFGPLFARNQQGIRVGMRPVNDQEALLDLLQTNNWQGPQESVKELSDQLMPLANRCEIVLDCTEPVSNYLGLECWFGGDPKHRIGIFFDKLSDLGLCSEAKKNALLAFPGEERVAGLGRLGRTINHVKVIWQDGKPVQAKTYLFFHFRPGT